MIYSVLYANNVQTICTAIWENSQVGSLAKEKGGRTEIKEALQNFWSLPSCSVRRFTFFTDLESNRQAVSSLCNNDFSVSFWILGCTSRGHE